MLVIDTREKPQAIKRIIQQLDEAGIDYMRSKLIVGDYMVFSNPLIIIDRKQDVAELCKNCTSDHVRFKAELETAKKLGVTLIILVEQDRYYDRGRCVMLKDISDLMLWSDPYTSIRGEQMYRILSSWTNKYDLRVEFCRKTDTGARIMEILSNGEDREKR